MLESDNLRNEGGKGFFMFCLMRSLENNRDLLPFSFSFFHFTQYKYDRFRLCECFQCLIMYMNCHDRGANAMTLERRRGKRKHPREAEGTPDETPFLFEGPSALDPSWPIFIFRCSFISKTSFSIQITYMFSHRQRRGRQ